MNPVPKPTHEKKLRQPLRSNSRLKTRTKIKQGKGNPFPDAVKKQVKEEQGGICEHPGCNKAITEFHHRKKKGMGSSIVWWINDRRQCSGLCGEHHRWTEEKIYGLLFYEALGVLKFGWWAGESMNLDEWVSVNEYRLCRANVDVWKLVKEIKQAEGIYCNVF